MGREEEDGSHTLSPHYEQSPVLGVWALIQQGCCIKFMNISHREESHLLLFSYVTQVPLPSVTRALLAKDSFSALWVFGITVAKRRCPGNTDTFLKGELRGGWGWDRVAGSVLRGQCILGVPHTYFSNSRT